MTSPAPQPAPDELDLAQLWRELTWSKAALVSCTLGSVILCLLLGLVSTRQYRADVTISPVETESAGNALSTAAQRLGALASITGFAFPAIFDESDIALATLKSRSFTLDFIEAKNLMPILFASRWDPARGEWRSDKSPPTKLEAWELFDRKVRRIEESDGGLYTISITWNNPAQAAEWANALVEQVNERLRVAAIHEARNSITYLNDELLKTSALGPQQLIHSMMESQINKIMIANVRKEYAFKIIDPALIPDDRSYVWPNYLVLTLLGLLCGAFAGSMISILLARRNSRIEQQ